MVKPASDHVGVVAIGRNEGERLRRCLESLPETGVARVYVDSGSTDGSVELARPMGFAVVSLDSTQPFSAARARNAGFEKIRAIDPAVEFVQFVDGDCEMHRGWLACAAQELRTRPEAAAVFGRVRERHAERSIYNRLCDMEWDGPIGDLSACGGIAMLRVAAFLSVGGFRADLIAGEEPELCFRLRQRGWRILRVPHEMVLHDADMTRFRQWWQRAVRSGHAYAEGAWLHGRSAERYRVREVGSIVLWAAALPLLTLIGAVLTGGWALVSLSAYPLLAGKIVRRARRRARDWNDASIYATFTIIAKFAQLQGLLRFWAGGLTGRRSSVIEYRKTGQPQPVTAESARSS